MNLKRHHILYILLALSLIIALVVFLTPIPSSMSYTAPSASSSAQAMSSVAATSTAIVASTIAKTAPSVLPLRFEVVSTETSQERGLGGRASISQNYAMLFVFPQDTRIGFWMKDMLTPIDMIWVSDSGTILGIEDSVSPSTYPEAFYPPQPVKYVLETRAGEARRRGWSVGTRVPLPAPYGLPSAH